MNVNDLEDRVKAYFASNPIKNGGNTWTVYDSRRVLAGLDIRAVVAEIESRRLMSGISKTVRFRVSGQARGTQDSVESVLTTFREGLAKIDGVRVGGHRYRRGLADAKGNVYDETTVEVSTGA